MATTSDGWLTARLVKTEVRFCSARDGLWTDLKPSTPSLQTKIEDHSDLTKGGTSWLMTLSLQVWRTVDIVSAYVAHNQVAASDLPKVISAVAGG
jgi:hypothetical protein